MAKQFNLFLSILLMYSFCYVTSSPIQNIENKDKMIAEHKEINNNIDSVTSNHNIEVNVPEASIPLVLPEIDSKQRVKRAIDPNQGSSWLKFVWRERKYKIPQMWLTNIRNLWAVDPAGGKHLFDAGVPYGTVYLIKTLILDSIFPRIGKNQ